MAKRKENRGLMLMLSQRRELKVKGKEKKVCVREEIFINLLILYYTQHISLFFLLLSKAWTNIKHKA